jgi:DMSO/TMAO reductase YedYZ molybdopterin-dependent catalytic subunit
MSHPFFDRRTLLLRTAGLAAAGVLAGCDRLSTTPWFRRVLDTGEDANMFVQRLLLSPRTLAPEYTEAELSPRFKPNGSTDPSDKAYRALAGKNFADWNLEIGGLVDRPQKFSLADLRGMQARTQITRHDCVEGWSCIGKWTGVPLGELLQKAGLKPQARYIVLHCADIMEGAAAEDESDDSDDPADKKETASAQPDSKPTDSKEAGDDPKKRKTAGESDDSSDDEPAAQPVYYYESIDLEDAYHPQTILAYEMNGAPLPVAYGAPLRLRVERALGYKMAKYVMRLEVVDKYDKFGRGKGGYWEDRGYDWYAGI